MKYARDKTGKDVKPDEVDSRIFLNCPVCKKMVHYVQKSKDGRKPHFAHNKGEGTIECENYHPRNQKKPANIDSSTISTIDPTRLFSDPNDQKMNKNKGSDYLCHLNIVLSNPTLNIPFWYLAIVFAKTSIQYNYVIKQGLMG